MQVTGHYILSITGKGTKQKGKFVHLDDKYNMQRAG